MPATTPRRLAKCTLATTPARSPPRAALAQDKFGYLAARHSQFEMPLLGGAANSVLLYYSGRLWNTDMRAVNETSQTNFQSDSH